MTPDDLTRWERLGKWDVPTTEVVLSGAPHVLLFKTDFQDYREAMRAVPQLIAEVRRLQQATAQLEHHIPKIPLRSLGVFFDGTEYPVKP